MADVVIWDTNGNEVFNSDTDEGMGEEFIASHPGQTFRIRIQSQATGAVFSGEMAVEVSEQGGQ
jgi:hypothetical protein